MYRFTFLASELVRLHANHGISRLKSAGTSEAFSSVKRLKSPRKVWKFLGPPTHSFSEKGSFLRLDFDSR